MLDEKYIVTKFANVWETKDGSYFYKYDDAYQHQLNQNVQKWLNENFQNNSNYSNKETAVYIIKEYDRIMNCCNPRLDIKKHRYDHEVQIDGVSNNMPFNPHQNQNCVRK